MKRFNNSNPFTHNNNKLSLLYLILLMAQAFYACDKPKPKENETAVLASAANPDKATGEKYVVDNKESVITYKGSMALASKGTHVGYLNPLKGELMIDNGKLAGGTVEIDMNTITDDHHRSDNNLVQHLKSPDFFDIGKFPASVFVVTTVVPVSGETINITGNLSIKGITHSVTFPAKIEVKDGIVYADGKLTIDRTQWDVRYKSAKFFSSLTDGIIADNIEFGMKIVAKK